jgi:hypothetical protein
MAAAEVKRRGLDLRRQAGESGEGLATAAAWRARIDHESRRSVAESARIAVQAVELRVRARQANARAAAARGLADAIERGEARWRAGVRSAREAEREREVEESWLASRTAGAPTRWA